MEIGHNKGKKYNVLKDTTQQLILKGIVADAIKVKSASKNNRLPHKYLSTIVQKYATACPWLKIGTIRNALYLHKKSTPLVVPPETTNSQEDVANSSSNDCPPPPSRMKRSRPVGSTNSSNRNLDLPLTAAMIPVYQNMFDKTMMKRMKKGRHGGIIVEDLTKHNLPENVKNSKEPHHEGQQAGEESDQLIKERCIHQPNDTGDDDDDDDDNNKRQNLVKNVNKLVNTDISNRRQNLVKNVNKLVNTDISNSDGRISPTQIPITYEMAEHIVRNVHLPQRGKQPSDYMRFKTIMAKDVKAYGTPEMKRNITDHTKSAWKKVNDGLLRTTNLNGNSINVQIDKKNFNIDSISYLRQLKARAKEEQMKGKREHEKETNEYMAKFHKACLVMLNSQAIHEITTEDCLLFKSMECNSKYIVWQNVDLPADLSVAFGIVRAKVQDYEHSLELNQLVKKLHHASKETLLKHAEKHLEALSQLDIYHKKERRTLED